MVGVQTEQQYARATAQTVTQAPKDPTLSFTT